MSVLGKQIREILNALSEGAIDWKPVHPTVIHAICTLADCIDAELAELRNSLGKSEEPVEEWFGWYNECESARYVRLIGDSVCYYDKEGNQLDSDRYGNWTVSDIRNEDGWRQLPNPPAVVLEKNPEPRKEQSEKATIATTNGRPLQGDEAIHYLQVKLSEYENKIKSHENIGIPMDGGAWLHGNDAIRHLQAILQKSHDYAAKLETELRIERTRCEAVTHECDDLIAKVQELEGKRKSSDLANIFLNDIKDEQRAKIQQLEAKIQSLTDIPSPSNLHWYEWHCRPDDVPNPWLSYNGLTYTLYNRDGSVAVSQSSTNMSYWTRTTKPAKITECEEKSKPQPEPEWPKFVLFSGEVRQFDGPEKIASCYHEDGSLPISNGGFKYEWYINEGGKVLTAAEAQEILARQRKEAKQCSEPSKK